MPGTFSQVYIQIVFAVKGRENLIGNNRKTELHKYITGIIKGKDQKPIIVDGMSDHIHAFIGLRPAMAIADYNLQFAFYNPYTPSGFGTNLRLVIRSKFVSAAQNIN